MIKFPNTVNLQERGWKNMPIKCLILEKVFNDLQDSLDNYLCKVEDNANVFILTVNEYNDQNCIEHSFLDAIDVCLKNKLQYINTIIVPVNDAVKYDNIKYILWFSKNKSKLLFDKDSIREKSIWKDVEWGKREKNYNSKGKDPGNVWIPTIDDGMGHITKHILLTESEIIEKLVKMSSATHREAIIDINHKSIYKPITPQVQTKKQLNSAIKYDVIFESSENMRRIKDNSVSLVVTSPPYWDLKNYFKRGQIGQESYDIYLARMNKVWSECYRILQNDGSIWININIRVKENNPILIPLDFIKQFNGLGMFLKQIFIWHKSSGIPTGPQNIVDRHEYILVFTKDKNTPIYVGKHNDYKNLNINETNIWNINRKAGSVGKKYIHPAIYPTELTNRIIKDMTAPNDLVCDPFLGSGTTLISCLNLQRSFVGYEYNEGFKDLIISRITTDVPNRSNNVTFI